MKLARIMKALRGTALSIVNGEDGFQWVGDGTAYYLVDQTLDLTEDNLLSVMDIDEKKRKKYTVRTIEGQRTPMIDICPQEGCDQALNPLLSASWAGELVTIMTSETGEAAAVLQSQIAPADGDEPLQFCLRRSIDRDTAEERQPVVAVFRDMLCCAVIMPVQARTMTEIWRMMRMASDGGLRYCVGEEEDHT